MASEAGKGSKQRPTDRTLYDESYDRIWGKKKKEPKDNYLYETDTDSLSDIKYDINMPEDRYEE